MTGPFDGAEIIHAYSRADAIADGVLVDVTDTAQEAGWRWPVAMTRAAWTDLVEWDAANGGHQDEAGRLWDVVYMARWATYRAPKGADRVEGAVIRVPNRSRCTVPRLARFLVHVGPGDDARPVVTILRDASEL